MNKRNAILIITVNNHWAIQQKSQKNYWSQIASLAAYTTTIYLALVVNNMIVGYFLLLQLITLPLNKNLYLVVNLWMSISLA